MMPHNAPAVVEVDLVQRVRPQHAHRHHLGRGPAHRRGHVAARAQEVDGRAQDVLLRLAARVVVAGGGEGAHHGGAGVEELEAVARVRGEGARGSGRRENGNLRMENRVFISGMNLSSRGSRIWSVFRAMARIALVFGCPVSSFQDEALYS